MQWKPFQFCGKIYDLAHLHPRSVTYVQAAKGDTPERVYRVDVIFGLHCFTRGRDSDVTRENALHGDDRETRVFDFARYELSKRLPEIVEGLAWRKCYHTGKGNFFSVEIVREDGQVIEYDIFFVASRSSAKGKINLFVQSAYVRDANHASSRPAKKPTWVFRDSVQHVEQQAYQCAQIAEGLLAEPFCGADNRTSWVSPHLGGGHCWRDQRTAYAVPFIR